MRRLAVICASVGLVVLAAAGPAAAATPQIEQDRDVSVSFSVGQCANFDIVGIWTVNLRFVTFLDVDGTPVRDELDAHWHGAITNPLNGNSIDDSGSFLRVTDLATGATRESGVIRHDTVPHLGIVYHSSGHDVYQTDGTVTFVSSKVDGPYDEACGVLA
jgi:hypothetical protein